MRLSSFLKDKIGIFLIHLGTFILILLMLMAFRVPKSLIVMASIIWFLDFFVGCLYEYLRKVSFYRDLYTNIKRLDKSYLVLETLNKPDFYEGKLIYNAMYDINKSMCDNITILERQISDFKEYIEMWLHEVKIPLASISLIMHNQKNSKEKIQEQLEKIEYYLEQILYYERCEVAEKDYLIKEVDLKKVINNIALRNKNELLYHKIDFKVENINYKVYSDSKWLEFMINQIVNNSIKYRDNNKESFINIRAEEEKDTINILIYDNGIGIGSSDLPRIFDKSFTGYNGRIKGKSTGMGLFIVKVLSEKLGHKVEIESKKGQYTLVKIMIAKNEFYDVLA